MVKADHPDTAPCQAVGYPAGADAKLKDETTRIAKSLQVEVTAWRSRFVAGEPSVIDVDQMVM
jgi:hypothetical protein